MATASTIECDFCGKKFKSYDGENIIPISIRISGPTVTKKKPEVRDEQGRVQAVAITESRVDHAQDIEITDLCSACYTGLRRYIKTKQARSA